MTPEYKSWAQMWDRCRNRNHEAFARYGGRGIKVCARWKRFENFLADMGRRPSTKHTLDRKDNDGNYTPKNCRWATKKEQARNRRTVVWLEARGERLTVTEWAERLGKSRETIYGRLHRGMSPEDALFATLHRGRKPKSKSPAALAGQPG